MWIMEDMRRFNTDPVYNRGKVLVEAGHEEDIIFSQIGEAMLVTIHLMLTPGLSDPKVLSDARAGIPVTAQRRFDVYADVSSVEV